MRPYLDKTSRSYVRAFAGQVAVLTLVGMPALLLDRHRPMLFLAELRAMFGLSALVSIGLAVLSRQRLSPGSLCIWDHVAALFLLKCGCSVTLWLLA